MNGVHDVWLFAATVFVLNATPGVDMMLTASRTLQYGARGGICAALGISTGCIVHTLAAAFGLAAALSASAAAFTAIKWAGAAYLAWLAIGMLRSAAAGAPRTQVAPSAAESARGWALFCQGLATNVLNPKIALFFLALLPQFIDATAADKTAAFLWLGAILVVQATLFMIAFVAVFAVVARSRRGRRASPVLRRSAQGAGALVLLGLAARLALTERP